MILVSPFRKWTCPYCFFRFHIADCAIVSATGNRVLRGPSSNPLHRVFPPSLYRDHRSGTLTRRQCPAPNCRRPLPDFFEDFDQRIVAVLGARSAGKSTYIASLIHQLLRAEHLLHRLNWIVYHATEETERIFRSRYEIPFWEQRRRLPATSSAVVDADLKLPLIYKLQSPAGVLRRRRLLHLVLFDAAGEDLQDDQQMAVHNRYIAGSAGLIFILDPMQFPALNEEMRRRNPGFPPCDPSAAPEAVLDRALRQIWRERGQRHGTRLSTPIALVFAKVDLLRTLGVGLTPTSAVFAQADHRTGFSEPDSLAVSHDIRQAIHDWGGGAFIRLVDQCCPDHRFFALSATGRSPDPQTQTYQTINPHRIYDPLFWMAARWRLIPKA